MHQDSLLRDSNVALLRSEQYMWIDALCINQKNILERNREVPRMKEIYEHARCVIIWLGPTSHDSHTALAIAQYLTDLRE